MGPDGVACGDTQWGHGVVTPQVEDDALREMLGNFDTGIVSTCVRTTPKRNAPMVRKKPAKRSRALDLRVTRAGSLVRVVCHRQTPGNTKMKTAARQPSRLITTPMLGISIANISEATNLKEEDINRVSLLKCITTRLWQ